MPHIPKVLCGKDNREMECVSVGVLIEMEASWGSYYKIYADKYECKWCEFVVYLPTNNILIEHWQEGYQRVRGGRENIKATFNED